MMFILMAVSSNVWANTVRVYGAHGDGYTDITTDDQGREIRRTHYGEDGVVKDHTEMDPDKGTRETTTYKDGKKEKKIKKDAEGREREEEVYDKDGRVTERTTTDENDETLTEEYQYDEKGRVIMVNKKKNAGGITESVDYAYNEEDGHLEHVIRFGRDEQGNPRVDGKITFDKDGNVTGREGNTDGLLEESKKHLGREFTDTGTHTTRDPLGNTVIVRHNPDGSYDVTVINSEGKVISRQYFGAGRCYLGDDCPFRHKNEEHLEDLPLTAHPASFPQFAEKGARN